MIKRLFELTPEVADFLAKYPVKTVATAALTQTYYLSGNVFALYGQYADDSLTAVIDIYGSGAHIAAAEKTDVAEIHDFIAFSGVSSVLMNSEDYAFIGDIAGFSPRSAALLAMHEPKLVPAEECVCVLPSLSDVHGLLENYIAVGDRDTFVADMQARVNHQTGRAVTVNVNGATAAAACVFFESEYCGFLGGVATHTDFRGKGYASVLVSQLCRDLVAKNKLPLISCTNPAAKRVYRSLGFEDIGENITLVRT